MSETLVAMGAGAGPAWPADRTASISTARAGMAIRQRVASAHASLDPPILREDGLWLMLDGRLDNRDELAAALGLPPKQSVSDARLALLAWRRWGEDMPVRLVGDFAIAIHDEARSELALIRDHLGVRPLFTAQGDGFFAFASSMPPLLALPFCDRRVNEQWAIDYLEEVKPRQDYTAFRGIAIFPPAHIATLRPDAPQRLRRYWSLTAPRRPLKITGDEAIARARALLDQAIACRLPDGGATACEISGGLDSSAIAAIAAKQCDARGTPLAGVTQTVAPDFEERFASLSESHFADALYAHCPSIERLNVTNNTDSLLATLAETLAIHGAPPRNDFNGICNETPRLLEARGIRVLLSGHGGDHVLTTYLAGLEESWLAERKFGRLIRRLITRSGWRTILLRLLRLLPPWRAIARRNYLVRRSSPPLASERALHSNDYPARYHLHDPPAWVGTLRERDRHNLARPVLSWRMQDSQIGAGARGVEYRYPLLDIRLIEFVHALPADIRVSHDEPRRLIRHMMGDDLPAPVRERRDKFGLTVPGVFVNIVRHARELRAHLAAMRDDPELAELARYDGVIALLDHAAQHGETPKETQIKAGGDYFGANHGQVLRLMLLGLWWRTRPRTEPGRNRSQANQTV